MSSTSRTQLEWVVPQLVDTSAKKQIIHTSTASERNSQPTDEMNTKEREKQSGGTMHSSSFPEPAPGRTRFYLTPAVSEFNPLNPIDGFYFIQKSRFHSLRKPHTAIFRTPVFLVTEKNEPKSEDRPQLQQGKNSTLQSSVSTDSTAMSTSKTTENATNMSDTNSSQTMGQNTQNIDSVNVTTAAKQTGESSSSSAVNTTSKKTSTSSSSQLYGTHSNNTSSSSNTGDMHDGTVSHSTTTQSASSEQNRTEKDSSQRTDNNSTTQSDVSAPESMTQSSSSAESTSASISASTSASTPTTNVNDANNSIKTTIDSNNISDTQNKSIHQTSATQVAHTKRRRHVIIGALGGASHSTSTSQRSNAPLNLVNDSSQQNAAQISTRSKRRRLRNNNDDSIYSLSALAQTAVRLTKNTKKLRFYDNDDYIYSLDDLELYEETPRKKHSGRRLGNSYKGEDIKVLRADYSTLMENYSTRY